jgi:hypothetical protein
MQPVSAADLPGQHRAPAASAAPISGRPRCRAGPGAPEPSPSPWCGPCRCARGAAGERRRSPRPAVATISGRVEDEPDPERRSLHRRPGAVHAGVLVVQSVSAARSSRPASSATASGRPDLWSPWVSSRTRSAGAFTVALGAVHAGVLVVQSVSAARSSRPASSATASGRPDLRSRRG